MIMENINATFSFLVLAFAYCKCRLSISKGGKDNIYICIWKVHVLGSKISHLLRVVVHYPCRLAWHWQLNHASTPGGTAGVACWPQHTPLSPPPPPHSTKQHDEYYVHFTLEYFTTKRQKIMTFFSHAPITQIHLNEVMLLHCNQVAEKKLNWRALIEWVSRVCRMPRRAVCDQIFTLTGHLLSCPW